jgi:single-strand DNA-binding protein
MADLNTVAFTGRVTIAPELRQTRTGTDFVSLRIVINDAVRNSESGEWEQKPNFVNVTVFGPSAPSLAENLMKGSPVSVSGRLSWREWTTDDGKKGQALEVVGSVNYLESKQEADARRERNGGEPVAAAVTSTSAPVDADPIPF